MFSGTEIVSCPPGAAHVHADAAIRARTRFWKLARLLKNKHQAVSQGARRFGKRSIFRICEHLQKPCNAGSRLEAKFFNSLIEPDHRLLPQGSKEARKTANAFGERFILNISEKFFRIGMQEKESDMHL